MKLLILLMLIYYMLPAFVANMAPVFSRFIIKNNTPLDFNKKIFNKRIFGNNKTWRGLILGIIAGTIIFGIQKLLHIYGFQTFSLINYSQYSILLGFLLSFGALAGDALESFIKRQLNIKPGKSFFPFDQIDYLIGSLVLSSIIYFPGWKNSILIIIIGITLHIIVNHIGYYLKIKNTKW